MSERSKVVLVVDDYEDVRELTEQILLRAGYTVIAASGAQEAEEAFRDNKVDLVVIDVNLPGMSGTEVVRRMRTVKPGLAVLFMTGYGSLNESDRREFPDPVISKPFLAPELRSRVAEILNQPSSG
jgi:CheY-like chemotaxis protein